MSNVIDTCACPVCGSSNAVVIFDDNTQEWDCGKGCQMRVDEEFHILQSAVDGNFFALPAHYVDTSVNIPTWTVEAKSSTHAMQLFWSHRNTVVEEFHILQSAVDGNFFALPAHYVDTSVNIPTWTVEAKSSTHAMQLFWSHRNTT